MVEKDNIKPYRLERDKIKPYQEIINLILANPVVIAITVFILVTIIVVSISFKYYESGFGKELLIEAHGMLFDILILGILILYLNILREKRIINQRYMDEIEDFGSWQSAEAAHRIAGSIRRLNKNRFMGRIILTKSYLNSANLAKVNLQKAELGVANLQEADLSLANLQEANLEFANLQKAKLRGVNLQEANLLFVYNLTIEQLAEVETLYKVNCLDLELMEQVKEKYPHLLEKPKDEEENN